MNSSSPVPSKKPKKHFILKSAFPGDQPLPQTKSSICPWCTGCLTDEEFLCQLGGRTADWRLPAVASAKRKKPSTQFVVVRLKCSSIAVPSLCFWCSTHDFVLGFLLDKQRAASRLVVWICLKRNVGEYVRPIFLCRGHLFRPAVYASVVAFSGLIRKKQQKHANLLVLVHGRGPISMFAPLISPN